MSKGRRILAWLFALGSVYWAYLTFSTVRYVWNSWNNWPIRNHEDVYIRGIALDLVLTLLAIVATWLLFKYRIRPAKQTLVVPASLLDIPKTLDDPLGRPFDEKLLGRQDPLGQNPLGQAFDESRLARRQASIKEVRPSIIKGRIREIRRWQSEGGFFSHQVLGFHLDYDRSLGDYGGLMVQLRLDYFRKLRLEDGDDLEIDLRWERDGSHCYVAGIRNKASGQRVEIKKDKNNKAGFLEEG
jgi:hypothetical protein